MTRNLAAIGVWCLTVCVVGSASGQTTIAPGGTDGPPRASSSSSSLAARAELGLAERMNDVVENVTVRSAPARKAFDWWAQTTGIPLLIDWKALSIAGVDPQAPVNLELKRIPAGQLLGLIMRQASPEEPLLYEATPWYIEVLTRQQANQRVVTRIYDVRDLLYAVPNFENPHNFDLRSVLSGSSSSSGGSTRSLFGERTTVVGGTGTIPSMDQRGEELARGVRDTVEPTIWQENGGTATLRYFQGRLIVTAPMYVQQQIGVPMKSSTGITTATSRTAIAAERPSGRSTAGSDTPSTSASLSPEPDPHPARLPSAGSSQRPVAGVSSFPSGPVAGVER